MKRLTWQNYDMCQFCGEGACCEHYCDNTFPVCDDKAIYDRLASIEDILGDEYDLELLQQQIQAYREGRYIILKEPEQAGVSRLRELAKADREGRCVVLPAPLGNTVYRIEYVDQCQGRYEIGICKHRFDILFYAMECRNFGKTVFLTLEEAEAALRREQDD